MSSEFMRRGVPADLFGHATPADSPAGTHAPVASAPAATPAAATAVTPAVEAARASVASPWVDHAGPFPILHTHMEPAHMAPQASRTAGMVGELRDGMVGELRDGMVGELRDGNVADLAAGMSRWQGLRRG